MNKGKTLLVWETKVNNKWRFTIDKDLEGAYNTIRKMNMRSLY